MRKKLMRKKEEELEERERNKGEKERKKERKKKRKKEDISHKRRAGVYRTTLEFRPGKRRKEQKERQ